MSRIPNQLPIRIVASGPGGDAFRVRGGSLPFWIWRIRIGEDCVSGIPNRSAIGWGKYDADGLSSG